MRRNIQTASLLFVALVAVGAIAGSSTVSAQSFEANDDSSEPLIGPLSPHCPDGVLHCTQPPEPLPPCDGPNDPLLVGCVLAYCEDVESGDVLCA